MTKGMYNCLASAELWLRMSNQKRHTRKVHKVRDLVYPLQFVGLPQSYLKKTYHTDHRVQIYTLLLASATRYVIQTLTKDLLQPNENMLTALWGTPAIY
jgi:hypothetical protein